MAAEKASILGRYSPTLIVVDRTRTILQKGGDLLPLLLEGPEDSSDFLTAVTPGLREPFRITLDAALTGNAVARLSLPSDLESAIREILVEPLGGSGVTPDHFAIVAIPQIEGMRPVITEQHMRAAIQHRARNILAVIRSIARRIGETARSKQELISHLTGRIDSFSRSVQLGMRSSDGGVSLEELISEELLSHDPTITPKVTIKGEALRLKARPAESLGLVFHELSINSIRFGAIGYPAGQVSVSWRLVGGESNTAVEIRWKETGLTPLDAATKKEPQRRGFGTDYLETGATYELGASTRLLREPDGLTYSISLPFDRNFLD